MKKQIRLVWLAVGALSLVLCVAIGPALARVWRCVGVYAAGEHATGRVITEHHNGVSVLVGGERTCFVFRGDLPASGTAVGDSLDVVFNTERPESCTTADTLEAAHAALTAIVATLVAMALGLVLLGIRVQRGLTEKPLLTTRLDIAKTPLACPRCGKDMEEGYLPLLAGMHWRRSDQPTGLPHPLRGLPGTVGWRKRPRVHGFRCEPCEIVLFRYGRRS